MGALKDWVKQDWVRIGTDGKIKGKCGTSKNKKNPDRCLPRAKAERLSKRELSIVIFISFSTSSILFAILDEIIFAIVFIISSKGRLII